MSHFTDFLALCAASEHSGRRHAILRKREGLDQERPGIQTGGSSWEEVCFDSAGSTGGTDAIGVIPRLTNASVGFMDKSMHAPLRCLKPHRAAARAQPEPREPFLR